MSTQSPLRQQTLTRADSSTEPAYAVSGAAYGKQRGVSREAVSKWKRADLLVFVDDDEKPGRQLIDVAASDARRAARQNPAQRLTPINEAALAAAPAVADPPTETPTAPPPAPAQAVQSALTLPPPAPTAPPPSAPTPPDPTLQDMAQLRAQALMEESREWDNKIKAARYAKLMGDLVSVDRVADLLLPALTGLRDDLLQLPVTLCEDLNPPDPATPRRLLRAALERVLNEGVETMKEALATLHAPDGTDDSNADATAVPAPDPIQEDA